MPRPVALLLMAFVVICPLPVRGAGGLRRTHQAALDREVFGLSRGIAAGGRLAAGCTSADPGRQRERGGHQHAGRRTESADRAPAWHCWLAQQWLADKVLRLPDKPAVAPGDRVKFIRRICTIRGTLDRFDNIRALGAIRGPSTLDAAPRYGLRRRRRARSPHPASEPSGPDAVPLPRRGEGYRMLRLRHGSLSVP